MKKILLATTLIAMSAGYAAAEVTVTAKARMGIIDNGAEDILGNKIGPKFTSRVRIIFTASGETDGGLTFGASVRNDQSGVGNTSNGDSTVYIAGAFGKLTMGDVSGAPDALVGQVSGVGLTGLNDMNEISYLGNPKTAALYEYSAGALTFGLGLGQANIPGDDAYSVAVKYSTDAYTVALGYEKRGAVKQTSLFGSGTFSGATIKATVADRNTAADMGYALSVDYSISGATVTAFYSDNSGFDTLSAYGLGASYDLGGGASVVGGIAKKEGLNTMFDLGVSMSF